VVHQGWVHTGVRGDRPDRRTPEAARGEEPTSRRQDLGTGVRSAGSAATSYWPFDRAAGCAAIWAARGRTHPGSLPPTGLSG
jgi:hypothetical protein